VGEGDLLAVSELAEQGWVLGQALTTPHAHQRRQQLALRVQLDALPQVGGVPVDRQVVEPGQVAVGGSQQSVGA
jgi:hypothetical protein